MKFEFKLWANNLLKTAESGNSLARNFWKGFCRVLRWINLVYCNIPRLGWTFGGYGKSATRYALRHNRPLPPPLPHRLSNDTNNAPVCPSISKLSIPERGADYSQLRGKTFCLGAEKGQSIIRLSPEINYGFFVCVTVRRDSAATLQIYKSCYILFCRLSSPRV